MENKDLEGEVDSVRRENQDLASYRKDFEMNENYLNTPQNQVGQLRKELDSKE